MPNIIITTVHALAYMALLHNINKRTEISIVTNRANVATKLSPLSSVKYKC